MHTLVGEERALVLLHHARTTKGLTLPFRAHETTESVQPMPCSSRDKSKWVRPIVGERLPAQEAPCGSRDGSGLVEPSTDKENSRAPAPETNNNNSAQAVPCKEGKNPGCAKSARGRGEVKSRGAFVLAVQDQVRLGSKTEATKPRWAKPLSRGKKPGSVAPTANKNFLWACST